MLGIPSKWSACAVRLRLRLRYGGRAQCGCATERMRSAAALRSACAVRLRYGGRAQCGCATEGVRSAAALRSGCAARLRAWSQQVEAFRERMVCSTCKRLRLGLVGCAAACRLHPCGLDFEAHAQQRVDSIRHGPADSAPQAPWFAMVHDSLPWFIQRCFIQGNDEPLPSSLLWFFQSSLPWFIHPCHGSLLWLRLVRRLVPRLCTLTRPVTGACG